MDGQLVQFLLALKQVLANPAVGEISDTVLRTQLQMVDRVLGRMLVQHTTLPRLESEARTAFAEAVKGAESLLSERGLSADALAQLRTLTSGPSPARITEVLRPLSDLQQQLCAIGNDEARSLRRALVAIETRLSTQSAEALAVRLAPAPDAGTTGAVHARKIDEAKFSDFLATAFPEERGVRLAGYSFVAGGHSKYTAKLQLSGVKSLPGSVVLRGDGVSKYGGVSVCDEYRLLQVLHRNGVSVPKPLAVEESGKVFGSPIMLVQDMPGRIIGHMFALPPPNAAICRDIAVQLARLHRIPASEFGPDVESAGRTNREKATRWLDESYASFKALNWPSPVYETAFHWLRENIALNDGPRGLVHGDYGLNNILIENDRASAILDWEFAHIGNPVYDLGYFCFQAERLDSWDAFQAAYREAGGVIPDKKQLDYSILFGATRLGVMVCQTEAGFSTGAVKGIGGAVASTGFHDVSVMRIAGVLDRVL